MSDKHIDVEAIFDGNKSYACIDDLFRLTEHWVKRTEERIKNNPSDEVLQGKLKAYNDIYELLSKWKKGEDDGV